MTHKFVLYLLLVVILFLLVVIAYLAWPWTGQKLRKSSSAGQSQSQIQNHQNYVRLPESLIPEFYDLVLEVTMPSATGLTHLNFNGSVTISILTVEETSVIKLNAHKSVEILDYFLTEPDGETVTISR